MRKGNLVKRIECIPDEAYYIPWFDTAVVVTDPYATIFTKQTEEGEAIYSQERIVVDVLVEGKILKNVPTEYLTKYSKT